MKKIGASLLSLLFFHFGFGQSTFVVQNGNKGLYLTHTVQAKENFYSIGRQYNAPPKEIAAFNSLDMAGGLSVGQAIQIPLTAANFSQKGAGGMPVYYVVGEKEGLYRVSLKNNNVVMASLRQWNKLQNDNISVGQKLIVGFLQSEEMDSRSITKVENEAPVVKETKDEPAPKNTTPPAEPKPAPVTASKPPAGGAGYFKNQFDLQSKEHSAGRDATVTSGIFKTSSGWQDAKYYALMDGVDPGTIVQVMNPVNNKSVYAKVLGEMSGIRQNKGLDLRISNAAATALDIAEPDKFIVRVLY